MAHRSLFRLNDPPMLRALIKVTTSVPADFPNESEVNVRKWTL